MEAGKLERKLIQTEKAKKRAAKLAKNPQPANSDGKEEEDQNLNSSVTNFSENSFIAFDSEPSDNENEDEDLPIAEDGQLADKSSILEEILGDLNPAHAPFQEAAASGSEHDSQLSGEEDQQMTWHGEHVEDIDEIF